MFNLYVLLQQQVKLIHKTTACPTYLLPANNSEYYDTRGLFEASLIKWCEQFGDPTKIMLDIGAHTGTYAISLAPKFRKVVCFEPQKATYYALCGSVAMSGLSHKVDCLRVGLGAPTQVGAQTLYIPSIDGGGSSLLPDTLQQVQAHETVEIRTLDEYAFTDVAFIKMDIEGNELNCLRGAIKTIAASHPKILFEANTTKELNAVTDFLALPEINYKVVAIGGYPNMFIGEHS